MPPQTRSLTHRPSPSPSPPSSVWPTPALSSRRLRMSYAIARGEQGVLTFEPYKSLLLPHWRFRTAALASESCATLSAAFDAYVAAGDFVGADMARKFVQMGMTRAKRYANWKGGRKYVKGGEGGAKGDQRRETVGPQETWEGREEKAEASRVFREGWRRCVDDGGYRALRVEWQREKKGWVERGEDVREGEDEEGEQKAEGEEDEELEVNIEDAPNG